MKKLPAMHADTNAGIVREEFLPDPGEPGLVSVVVPTYNRAHVVGLAIDSILAQSYDRLEVIVIDDGSQDNTLAVVAKYDDPRVRYFRTENGGMSAARNRGLAQARGEFIAFLDSDDTWFPWKLAAQIEILRREPEVGAVWSDMSAFVDDPDHIVEDRYLRSFYTAYQRFDIAGVLQLAGTVGDVSADAPARVRDCPYYVGSVFREMFIGSLVQPSTAVVRRERVRKAGGFDFELTGPGAEDYHFYYKISEHGAIAFLDAPTTTYRIGEPSQLSRATLAQARGNLNVVLHWLARKRPPLPDEVERTRVTGAYQWAGKEELFGGNIAAARHNLREALRLEPKARTFVLYLLSLMPDGTVGALRSIKHKLVKQSASASLVRTAHLI
jgi:glycosyltransferase involved in cell wall biosynthesis